MEVGTGDGGNSKRLTLCCRTNSQYFEVDVLAISKAIRATLGALYHNSAKIEENMKKNYLCYSNVVT